MRILFSVLIVLFGHFSSIVQILNPVKWDITQESLGNDEFNLIYTATIDKGWTVYSQFTNDEGPVPTSITFDNPEVVELMGDAKEEGKRKEGFDKVFELDVIKFLADKPFEITQKVKVIDYNKPLVGYLTFMTCDANKCLPPVDIDFDFTFNKSGSSNALNISNGSTNKKVQQSKEAQKSVVITSNSTSSAVNVSTNASNVTTTNVQQVTKDIKSTVASDTPEETSESKEEIKEPVKWDVSLSKQSDTDYTIQFKANVHPNWNTYSVYTPEGGPLPTELIFESTEGYLSVGSPVEQGHKKEQKDPLFDNVPVIKFLPDEPHVITQKLSVTDPSKPIQGYLSYMACDKSHCIPPTDVEFNFVPAKGLSLIYPPYVGTGNDLGPNIKGNVLDQSIPSIKETYLKPLANCGTQIQSADGSMWQIFIGGFIGGLLAILLPCIFPMIPITVSFFTNDNKRPGWVNGLVYAISIIVIFVSIGLAVTALLGPEALNKLSTDWIANVAFFLIFIAFAISFFGYFEITLPSSWSTKSDAMADKGGFLGTFFMAATLAIVSFSCTGPIIGTALVQVANTGNYLGPFMIMFGFSLALAIPFGLFAAFPSWLNSLPRSGSWMNSVKVVLGFIELALALKFLSVADMTSNWGFLKYELFMGLWVIIFAAMTAYLFGFFRFPHDSPVKKLSAGRKIFGVLSLIFTLYIASGFMIDKEINSYKIPKLVSGITPPASYNFFIAKNELDPSIKAKYPSYTKCANDINCFKDYYDGIAFANEVSKPVLLDFTGYGCVNCRKTEDYIWKDPAIKSQLNDDYVLVSLYVDDRKKLDEIMIAKSSGKKMRNVGNKWADFQIVNFQQNSQPLYVPLTPDQKVITAPRGYEEGVENYKQFLDCGLAEFRK